MRALGEAKHDGLLPILESLKKMGYDGVEVPIFELDVDKYAQWGKRLDDLGLDWDAVYKRYRPLVDHVGRREDLNTVMVEMIAETTSMPWTMN